MTVGDEDRVTVSRSVRTMLGRVVGGDACPAAKLFTSTGTRETVWVCAERVAERSRASVIVVALMTCISTTQWCPPPD